MSHLALQFSVNDNFLSVSNLPIEETGGVFIPWGNREVNLSLFFEDSVGQFFSGYKTVLPISVNLKLLQEFPDLMEIVCILEEIVYTLRALQVMRKITEF